MHVLTQVHCRLTSQLSVSGTPRDVSPTRLGSEMMGHHSRTHSSALRSMLQHVCFPVLTMHAPNADLRRFT